MAEEETVYVSKFHWFASVPITIAIAILGFIGNTLSVIVWKRIHQKRNKANEGFAIFAIALAVSDNFVLIFLLLTDTVLEMFKKLRTNCIYVYFYCYFAYFTFFYVIFISIYTLLGLALTRLQVVWKPFSRFDKKKYFYHVISAVILTWSFLVNIPAFFEYRPSAINGTCSIQKSEYAGTKEFQYLLFITHCLLGAALPWVTILLSNIIIFTIYRRSLQRTIRHIQKLTGLLLLMSTSTLIFLAFQCVTRCFRMLHDERLEKWKVYDDWYAFGKLGIVLNSSANFYIISLPGKIFYKELVKTLNRTKEVKKHIELFKIKASPSLDYRGN